MDGFMRAVVTDWIQTVLWPSCTRGVAQAGQTDITMGSAWNVTYDVPIVYINGRRRLGGVTWFNSTTVRISPAMAEGDAFHVFVSPGAGSGYLPRSGATLLAAMSAGGFKITNGADPVDAQDFATKHYVDNILTVLVNLDTAYLRLDGGNVVTADISLGGAGLKIVGLPTTAVPTSDGADDGYAVSHKQLRDYVASLAWKPGNIKWTAVNSIETGWLECDGSEISRTTYAALFSAIGTIYGGGNGSSTFNLPDMRGRSQMGAGTGLGSGSSGSSGTKPAGTAITARTAGDWTGEETHLLVTAELPSHTHNIKLTNNAISSGSNSAQVSSSPESTVATAAAGSDTPHNNMPPRLVMRCMIKT